MCSRLARRHYVAHGTGDVTVQECAKTAKTEQAARNKELAAALRAAGPEPPARRGPGREAIAEAAAWIDKHA